MSWTRAYRLTLSLLPGELRRKHGPAMEALFARELGRARARGRLAGALAGAAGIWDVVRRSVYEQVRPVRDAVQEFRAHPVRAWWYVDAHGSPPAAAPLGGSGVSALTTRELLRRHAASFAVAFVGLTVLLLTLFATRRVPALSARGAPAGAIVEVLLLAVPFTAAMTIPIAVLVAVLAEFTQLRADGRLATRREGGGVARLVVPVLAAAVAVSALTLALNTELLPRANARLAAVLAGRPTSVLSERSDREMTINELRAAARLARAERGPHARAFAAMYEVEVQKKYALAAACVVLALAGVAIALRVPHGRVVHGGATFVISASGAVVGTYYMVIVTGEDLANRLVVSPVVGMWGANALVLAVAVLVTWRRRATVASSLAS